MVTYLMSVHTDWHAKRSGQAKVREFDVTYLVNEEVLRLEISVQYPMGVTVRYSLQ